MVREVLVMPKLNGTLVLLAAVLPLAVACAEPESSEFTFHFEAYTPVDVAVTDVRVDGASVALTQESDGRYFRFEREYTDYPVAQVDEPILVEFLGDHVVRYSGQLLPGACARRCPGVQCPQGYELRSEELQLPFAVGFGVYDYSCMHCVGDTYDTTACP